MTRQTPSQTAGPYVHIGCVPNESGISGVYAQDLGAVPPDPSIEGECIAIRGRITDGEGAPITDALIEFWQADAAGRYGADADFVGFARRSVDEQTGEWVLETIKPGATGDSAPHIAMMIMARGINTALHTRLYFADEGDANALDPLLTKTVPVERCHTMMAEGGAGQYRFDIALQGPSETVFLDL